MHEMSFRCFSVILSGAKNLYNKIKNEKSITIDYSHNDDSVLTKKIKWIKSVSLNHDTGHFEVHYNEKYFLLNF